MHQPDYRDSEGVMKMPWVFFHAIKDYYEMPWLLSQYDGLKASFNITPPLIEQLDLYKDPRKNDYFLGLWAQDPASLNDDERDWLIKTCKSTQYETMIKPIEYLATLFHKDELNTQELIDFEMLFMLSWCGNYLRKENSLVAAMFEKGKHFTFEDKARLLDELSAFVATILPFYAALQKQGVISLSTTPYNHPILPLLLNMDNAKRANSHTTLPDNPMSLREDAIEQVERSIALYKKTFGIAPKGFWPAEGAVDEESIDIYKSCGISWIATDEAILFRSLGDDTRANLFKPYIYNGMTIGFRDHGLSDLIGFTYRFKSGDDASEHFLRTVEPIRHTQKNATVFVILDGENAWEFFENNAYEFFTSLYEGFLKTEWCHTVTMDEMTQLDSLGTLDRLAPGSWIHGNFDTWSGHSEKNRAWELIYQTKRDYENYNGELTEESRKQIQFHFLASECSDWFWWYGDDHVTEFGQEFDALFREHLITIYRLMEMQPPADLFIPIISHKSTASFLIKPQSAISPLINGKDDSFFEWIGCGSIDESKLYSTMDRVRGPIDMIHYGHDDTRIFLAFEGDISSLKMSSMKLEIIIEETGEHFNFDFPVKDLHRQDGMDLAVDKRIEMAISKALFKDFSIVHLRFEIVKEDQIIQTMPGYGALCIDLNETYTSNWFI